MVAVVAEVAEEVEEVVGVRNQCAVKSIWLSCCWCC